jgi:hypothetical protein
MTIDKAGSSIAASPLGGNMIALTGGLSPISAPNLKSGAVTDAALIFNFVTAIAVPENGKVIVNLPFNYLQSQSLTLATSTAQNLGSTCAVTNTPANSCPPIAASAKIECTVATGGYSAGSKALTFQAGWKSGDPAVTGAYTVQTTLSSGSMIEGPNATPSLLQQFTKGVLSVAPTFSFSAASTDLAAQLQSTTGTFTLQFKTVNAVPVGGQIVLDTSDPWGLLLVISAQLARPVASNA